MYCKKYFFNDQSGRYQEKYYGAKFNDCYCSTCMNRDDGTLKERQERRMRLLINLEKIINNIKRFT